MPLDADIIITVIQFSKAVLLLLLLLLQLLRAFNGFFPDNLGKPPPER